MLRNWAESGLLFWIVLGLGSFGAMPWKSGTHRLTMSLSAPVTAFGGSDGLFDWIVVRSFFIGFQCYEDAAPDRRLRIACIGNGGHHA